MKTKRLLLRRFTLNDVEPMFNNWANDPDVTEYLMWQPHGNISVTKDVLNDWVSSYERDNYYHWGIVVEATGELIGGISTILQDDKIEAEDYAACGVS
ncbi:MAG: GNAT family N-acetyltransferase [Oscillospiraceae bacterium]|nr:GNAT family N-acetyltransferase [Oscillospiraceae bacterium]